MEVTNANWKEILLRQAVELGSDDKIIFAVNNKVYSYVVTPEFLQKISPYRGENDIIFRELGLETDEEIRHFCENHYGYHAPKGFWPQYRHDDYNAATNIVIEIYTKIERIEFDKVVSVAQKGSISVQEDPVSTEEPVKDIGTIKITIKPTQTFKIIL